MPKVTYLDSILKNQQHILSGHAELYLRSYVHVPLTNRGGGEGTRHLLLASFKTLIDDVNLPTIRGHDVRN